MSLLEPPEIDALCTIIVDANHLEDGLWDAALAVLPAEHRAHLPEGRPGPRLRMTLAELSSTGPLADGNLPLELVLRSLKLQTTIAAVATELERLLALLPVRHAKPPTASARRAAGRKGGLEQELATVLARALPRADDVDRIVAEAGLTDVARHQLPDDHWSAAIASAIAGGRLTQLLDAAAPQCPGLDRARFAPLATVTPAGGRTALDLAVDWEDEPDAPPCRVEDRGKRCPAVATIRVFGGAPESEPHLDWRSRRLFGRGPWQRAELVGAGAPQAGFRVWKAPVLVEIGRLRTWQLEARASLDDQVERQRRLVVPHRGLHAAIGVLIGLLAFIGLWLRPLPSLGIVLGLGSGVVLFAGGAARGLLLDKGSRGPLWGLGILERALALSVLAAIAVVVLPPLLLVIVDNRTRTEVKVRTDGMNVITFEAGQGRTLATWDRPADAIQPDMCLCPGKRPDLECPCVRASVRRVPIVRVQCRRQAWSGLGAVAELPPDRLALTQATAADGIVWRVSNDRCVAVDDATATFALDALSMSSAPGVTVTVRHPWRSDLAPLHVDPTVAASRMVISGPTAKHWMIVEGASAGTSLTLPVIEPTWDSLSLELVDHARMSTLSCKALGPLGTGGLELVGFAVPADARVTVSSGVTSTWEGAGLGRACLTKGSTDNEVELKFSELAVGASLRLPTVLRATSFKLQIGGRTVPAPPCKDPLTVIAIDRSKSGALSRLELSTGGTRPKQWIIEPFRSGKSTVGVVCGPPTAATTVVEPGSTVKLVLDGQRLRPLVPPPVPPPVTPPTTQLNVCVVKGTNFGTVTRADKCPLLLTGGPCPLLTGPRAQKIMDVMKRKQTPCTVVCQCPAR